MKVGEYVRFDYHRVSVPIQIARITETHYDDEDDSICYSTDIGLVIDESNLVKEPSPDIIDLIEVGDYVNGGQVRETEKDYIRISGGGYIWQFLKKEEIKSIVTKEQFKSIKYEVEE